MRQLARPGCHEGLDEIAEGPAGQLRWLATPGGVISGIPGVAVEAETMTIVATPPDVVAALREDRFGDIMDASEEDDSEAEGERPTAAASGEPPF